MTITNGDCLQHYKLYLSINCNKIKFTFAFIVIFKFYLNLFFNYINTLQIVAVAKVVNTRVKFTRYNC